MIVKFHKVGHFYGCVGEVQVRKFKKCTFLEAKVRLYNNNCFELLKKNYTEPDFGVLGFVLLKIFICIVDI